MNYEDDNFEPEFIDIDDLEEGDDNHHKKNYNYDEDDYNYDENYEEDSYEID